MSRELSYRERNYYNINQIGLCEIDKNGLKNFNFNLLAGNYPADDWNDTDILISKYTFEIFQLCGYKDSTETDFVIENYVDIIGKNFYSNGNFYTVKGIIDTHVDEIFAKIKDYSLDLESTIKINKDMKDLMNASAKFFQKSVHNIVYKKPTDSIKSDINYLIHKNNILENKSVARFVLDSDKYEFVDQYSIVIQDLASALEDRNSVLIQFLVAGIIIVFAFAAFILGSFIISSVRETKKEIAILRSVGASKKDILLIYLFQSLIIFFAIFVVTMLIYSLAIIPLFKYIGVVSFYLPISLYVLSFADFLILIGSLLLIILASYLIPLFLISRKTPSQILSD